MARVIFISVLDASFEISDHFTTESSNSDHFDEVFDGIENEAFEDEFDYVRKTGVVRIRFKNRLLIS